METKQAKSYIDMNELSYTAHCAYLMFMKCIDASNLHKLENHRPDYFKFMSRYRGKY